MPSEPSPTTIFFLTSKGSKSTASAGLITTNTFMVNSLGNIEHWQLTFKCIEGIEATGSKKMQSPKSALRGLDEADIDKQIKAMIDDQLKRFRLKQFFVNEYYPAIIHTDGKMVVLENTVEGLIARGALSEYDRAIVKAVVERMCRNGSPARLKGDRT